MRILQSVNENWYLGFLLKNWKTQLLVRKFRIRVLGKRSEVGKTKEGKGNEV